MTEWRDIKTARTDRPILTDDGLVIYQEEHRRWVYCGRSGETFSCADNGMYCASPAVWIEVDEEFYRGTSYETQERT